MEVDHDGRALAAEKVVEAILLLSFRAEEEVLGDGGGRLTRLTHRDVRGPPQVLSRYALHRWWHRRREHECLTVPVRVCVCD